MIKIWDQATEEYVFILSKKSNQLYRELYCMTIEDIFLALATFNFSYSHELYMSLSPKIIDCFMKLPVQFYIINTLLYNASQCVGDQTCPSPASSFHLSWMMTFCI